MALVALTAERSDGPHTAPISAWPCACCHVMNRGNNRETVFADAEDCRYFLGLLDRYRHRFSFQLYHYCLLTNHFHLLLQMKSAKDLSACMA